MVWYSHLFQNFPQFIVIHTVKGFGIVNKTEIDVFLELSCFFDEPADVGNLSSSSSAFLKTSLNIWKFMVHLLLKPGLENFEHYFARMWDECNCGVVWAFFGIGMKTDLFQSCGHCWVFQICWHIECSTFTARSFRIWNSSTGILSPPLALFIVMLPKAHLTSHFRISGSRWVITPSWLSGSWRSFLYSSSVYSCHLFLISSASVGSIPFLSFMVPIFAWNVLLVSLIFLKRSLVFPFCCFPLFLCIDHWGSLSYLSLLFFGTMHSNGYIFTFLLCLMLLFFSQLLVSPPPPDYRFAFLHFFFLGMVLITASCIMSQTSIHSSSGILSVGSNPLNLLVTSTVKS